MIDIEYVSEGIRKESVICIEYVSEERRSCAGSSARNQVNL